jgi:hypothetical protein
MDRELARIVQKKSTFKFFAGKPEGRRLQGRHRNGGSLIIKTHRRGIE